MSNQRTIEAKGSDVEAAIANGLAEAGLSRDKVTIDILDEGSRGLFGLGGRPAVVRLTPVAAAVPVPTPTPVRPPAPPPPPPPAPAKPMAAAAPPRPAAPAPRPQPEVNVEEQSERLSDEELANEGEAVLDVVQTLLNYLTIPAETSLTLSEPDDLTGQQINIINITGDDLAVLIGPRGETLDALQYITRLMVSNRLQSKAMFTLDVESYRQRRKEALARLAERMARKVTKQGRPVTLEPMPPHERRAVHIALRNFRGVYTQSTGTGDRRRVRIFPER